jgi:hypothetical protein
MQNGARFIVTSIRSWSHHSLSSTASRYRPKAIGLVQRANSGRLPITQDIRFELVHFLSAGVSGRRYDMALHRKTLIALLERYGRPAIAATGANAGAMPGVMTVTIELDGHALNYLVHRYAPSTSALEFVDRGELRRTVGEAISALIRVSA